MGNGCGIYFDWECRIGWRMGVFDRFIVIAIELFLRCHSNAANPLAANQSITRGVLPATAAPNL